MDVERGWRVWRDALWQSDSARQWSKGVIAEWVVVVFESSGMIVVWVRI